MKYKTASLPRSRCDLINEREVNIRPIDIPAAKAIIINFFLELSAINTLPAKHEFYFDPLFFVEDWYLRHLFRCVAIFGIWRV